MGLLRALLIGAAVLLGWWLWRAWLRARDAAPSERTIKNGQAPAKMARCAHCGLFVPMSEAVISGALTFCSADHRDRHGARQD
jgi:uncharacterized protein